jgi:hypothetical protein
MNSYPSAHFHYRLNRNLDLLSLKRTFSANRRLHVLSILQGKGAEHLYQCLSTYIQWTLHIYANKQTWEIAPETSGQHGIHANDKLLEYAYTAARTGFAYVYESGINLRVFQPDNVMNNVAGSFFTQFVEFLNTPAFIKFVRDVTGDYELTHASARATCFRAGHFLNLHTDYGQGLKKFAYVFNLSRHWNVEWGGVLQFVNSEKALINCFMPIFNSFCIFAVPQWHAVSFVAPFAGDARYAVSGWLYKG